MPISAFRPTALGLLWVASLWCGAVEAAPPAGERLTSQPYAAYVDGAGNRVDRLEAQPVVALATLPLGEPPINNRLSCSRGEIPIADRIVLSQHQISELTPRTTERLVYQFDLFNPTVESLTGAVVPGMPGTLFAELALEEQFILGTHHNLPGGFYLAARSPQGDYNNGPSGDGEQVIGVFGVRSISGLSIQNFAIELITLDASAPAMLEPIIDVQAQSFACSWQPPEDLRPDGMSNIELLDTDGNPAAFLDPAGGQILRVFYEDWPGGALPVRLISTEGDRLSIDLVATSNDYFTAVLPPVQLVSDTGAIDPTDSFLQTTSSLDHITVEVGDSRAETIDSQRQYELALGRQRLQELSITKQAQTQQVAVGDVLGYTIELANNTLLPITDARLIDHLPRGLRLIEDTVRLNGEVAAILPNQPFSLSLGTLTPGQTHRIEYAVQVLPGAIGSPAINSAEVTGTQSGIDVASATVSERVYVDAPLFHEEATILGQVFADCDRNGERGATEPGLAGIAVRLLNGRQVLSDAQGKFSFGRVHPGKTIIWLPSNGTENRQLLDPIAGEIRRVDFALAQCETRQPMPQANSAPAPAQDLQDPAAPPAHPAETRSTVQDISPAHKWAGLDNTFAFVDLADGARRASPTLNLVVKAPMGTTVELYANDHRVDVTHRGNAWQDATRQAQFLEFVGVPISVGANALTARLYDAFGVHRGSLQNSVIRTGAPFAWRLDSAVPLRHQPDMVQRLTFSLLDQNDHIVAEDLPVTVSLPGASWQTADADKLKHGLQSRTHNGVLELAFIAPLATNRATVEIHSGNVSDRFDLSFDSAGRDFTLLGMLELGHAERSSTAGRDEANSERYYQPNSTGQRGAMFAQGAISDNYDLTLVWDSAKPRPDVWQNSLAADTDYHSYGDQSQSLMTGQSSRKLYTRLEGARDWYQIGDLTPQTPFRQARASRYQRRAFGVQQHFQSEQWRIDSFAGEADEQEIVEEFRARGTSGPFQLKNGRIQRGRETVEIVVRSRFGIETDIHSLTGHDYRLEYLSGRLLLAEPLAATAPDGSEIYLRVRYHVDQRKPVYYDIYGASIARQIGPANFGLSTAVETGGGHDYQLTGAQLEYQLGPQTVIFADAARSKDHGTTAVSGVLNSTSQGSGNAQSLAIRHRAELFNLNAELNHADERYINSGAAIPPGVLDANIDAQLQLQPGHGLQLKLSHTEVDAMTTASPGVSDASRAVYSIEPTANWSVDLGAGYARFEREGGDNNTDVRFISRHLYGGVRYQPGYLPNLTLATAVQQDFDSERRAISSQIRYALGDASDVWIKWTGRKQMDRQNRPDDSHFDSEWGFGLEHRFNQRLRLAGGLNGPNGRSGDNRAALGLEYVDTAFRSDWEFELLGERILDLSDAGRHGYGISSQLRQPDDGNRYTRIGLEWEHGIQRRTTLLAETVRRAWDNWAWLASTRLEDSHGTTSQRRDLDLGVAFRPTQRQRWSVLMSADLQQDDNAQHVTVRLNGERALSQHTHLNLRLAHRASRHTEPYSAANRQLLIAARLRHQLHSRFRISVFASHTRSPGNGSSAEGYGMDLRTTLNRNFGLTVGYNRFGYRDRVLDISSEEHRGWFVNLDAIFDQHTLSGLLGRLR